MVCYHHELVAATEAGANVLQARGHPHYPDQGVEQHLEAQGRGRPSFTI